MYSPGRLVEGPEFNSQHPFPKTSSACEVMTSPAPSSSASQVVLSESAMSNVVLSCPQSVSEMVAAGVPVELALASYERMYMAYCMASSGQSIVGSFASVRSSRSSRRRRRVKAATASPVSQSSIASRGSVTGVPTQNFDVVTVEQAISVYGDGYCYLWFFEMEHFPLVAEALGPAPSLAEIVKIPLKYWRAASEIQVLGVKEVECGVFHVFTNPTGGTVRGMTFLRSAVALEVPLVSSMRLTPCTMPGVNPQAVVGALEVSSKLPAQSPVAYFEEKPVHHGRVMGGEATGRVVEFTDGQGQLVAMHSDGLDWWAFCRDLSSPASSSVHFQKLRRLPTVFGVPTLEWEGYSYLAFVLPIYRHMAVVQLGRSPSLERLAMLPVSHVDLERLKRFSFVCGERGLTLWQCDPGVSPDASFEALLNFAMRRFAPGLGTLGDHLVRRGFSSEEECSARLYARWVTRGYGRVGTMGTVERRMPFYPSEARVV